MTTFLIEGKEKELTYMVNGCDCSGDLIGNSAHGLTTDEEGRYIATQDDFDWWTTYFENDKKLEKAIAEAEEKHGRHEVVGWLQANGAYAVDMEDEYHSVMVALKELDNYPPPAQ